MTVTGPDTGGTPTAASSSSAADGERGDEQAVPPADPRRPDPQRPARLSLGAQLVRFVVIGGLAALVDLGVYQLLVALGVWAPLGKGVAFVLGTTTAYLLNRRFTFASSAGGGGRFAGVALLYGSTFAVNVAVATLVLWWLDAPTVGTPPLAALVSWFVAQACATTINFVVMRFVIFRD